MRVRHGCLVGTLLASFLTAAPASAQPIEPLGTQTRLTQAASKVYSADVAYNSVRDEYLVVWLEGTPGYPAEVWARRLHGDGSSAGEPFLVVDCGGRIMCGSARRRTDSSVSSRRDQ